MIWLMVFLGGLAFAALQALAWGGFVLMKERKWSKAGYVAGVAALGSLVFVWGLFLVSEAFELLQSVIYA